MSVSKVVIYGTNAVIAGIISAGGVLIAANDFTSKVITIAIITGVVAMCKDLQSRFQMPPT